MKKYALAISFLLIVAASYFSFVSLMPQSYSDASTTVTEFSTERALTHLKKITQKPHYVGADEHKNVRNYIIRELEKLGLKTHVQDTVVFDADWKRGTRPQNILARIKGTESGKALLLLAHYDSAPHSSLGASDDGSGVVTILESVRAFLAKNETPKNDIIILISDAEELGLFGAKTFVRYHPWAKDVGLVINFEARGSGGPSYMMIETNGSNKKMIEEFSNANPKYPVATSLAYSIYKMIPNDTDLTVFREEGDIEGFNFAFIGDHFDYHTQQDSYERLDKNTLEHQGTYLMPLLNYFAYADLSNLKSDVDYIYFNFPFIGVVSYPFSWVFPMLIVTILSFLGVLFFGISKKKVSTKNVGKGFIPFLVSLVIAGLVGYYGWTFIKSLHPQYNDISHGFTYNGYLYLAAFAALALAICFMVYKKWFKKYAEADLFIAPVVFWMIINVLIILYLKGAAFFVILLIYAVFVLAVLVFSKAANETKMLLITLLAVPVLIIFAQMPKMFPVALGLGIIFINTIMVTLLFGLLIPVFANYKNIKIGRLFLVLSLVIFVTASFQSSYTEDRRKPNSINYVLDVDKNEAYFTSYNQKNDEFTEHFLTTNPSHGHYHENEVSSMKFHKKTEVRAIKLPVIQVNSDTIIENERFIDVDIIPKRKTNRIILTTKDTIGFKRFAVNGWKFPKKYGASEVFRTINHRTICTYILSDKDSLLNLKFSVNINEVPKIDLLEISYDLQTVKAKERPENMMPVPFRINDAIMVKKQIDFDKN